MLPENVAALDFVDKHRRAASSLGRPLLLHEGSPTYDRRYMREADILLTATSATSTSPTTAGATGIAACPFTAWIAARTDCAGRC